MSIQTNASLEHNKKTWTKYYTNLFEKRNLFEDMESEQGCEGLQGQKQAGEGNPER